MTTIESELEALKAVALALEPLDKAARARVLEWAVDFFKAGPK